MINPKEMTTVEKELLDAVQHVAGGRLNELPQSHLETFARVVRGMSEIAEAEIRRRGVYRFPIFSR